MENENNFQLNANQPSSPIRENVESVWSSIKEWVQVIIIALIIALPVRWFVAEPFIVNGASMDPTFATGQFLVVDRLTYHFKEPARGDVIVFEYPNDPSTYYIKRIIGLPGEGVDIKDGKITITNKEHPEGFTLNEPYLSPEHLSLDTSYRTLGPTQYFVMGDNRAQSSDSRFWGPLDKHFIVGRPVIRLLPLTKISLLPGQESQ
ncbi:MAG TPA: signal peptidase I [Candidatus Paceibacterota bacterium]|nr:signal peptidase I [Candidatus Paceibacterota bacterium]